MLLSLALVALIVVLFAVLIIGAVLDRGGDDDADPATSGPDVTATVDTDLATSTDPGVTDGSTPITSDDATTTPTTVSGDGSDGAATTVPPSTATAPPPPGTTQPGDTGGAGGSGSTGGSGSAGGSNGAGGAGGSPDANGRSVQIVGSRGSCRFGDRCLIAGFSVDGFSGGEKEYVCEFSDGSRYTFLFETTSVEYACATGLRPDSITIEVDGVRSATITTTDELPTK
jgi:hypothetical protein